MSSLRRCPRSPAAPPPLEDDDLLSEILLRLPPQPSSLPRASSVCRSWRSVVADPQFHRRFRLRHRCNPPLLGFVYRGAHGLYFVPTLESPNRVPPGRFSLQLDDNHFRILGCRHGLVLIFDQNPFQFLVWDPVTGKQNRLAVAPGFDLAMDNVNGAVLSFTAGDVQHFKVVLVKIDMENRRWLGCIYSSETGVWGNLISTPIPSWDSIYATTIHAVLVGDSLYFIAMLAEGGGLGFLSLSGLTAQLWKRKIDSDGVASWVKGRTIELDKLLSLNSDSDKYIGIRGFAEDNNSVFFYTAVSLFIVQFESLQFKKLIKPEMRDFCYPFESIYAAGI